MIKFSFNFDKKDYPTFIIAEAGVNHNGDIEIAKKLIDVAVVAGADAVKFQTFKADDLVTKSAAKANYQNETTDQNESHYDMLKKHELSKKDHKILMDYCKRKDILFMSTPFDFRSVDLLEELGIEFYKVSSGDLTNIPLLEYIARIGKPMIVSTGMANLGEVEEAVNAIQETGNNKLTLLHCITNYPADYEGINLKAMKTLKQAFNLPVGYSDHSLGIEVSIAAVAMGARVIEKHFTLDKNMEGPDHRASLNPEELKRLVIGVRNIESALGDGIKRCQNSELDNRVVARKSIVAKEDIKKGQIIIFEHIEYKRPAKGLSPIHVKGIVGRKAKEDIKKGSLITYCKIE